jgi:hypothetical protein
MLILPALHLNAQNDDQKLDYNQKTDNARLKDNLNVGPDTVRPFHWGMVSSVTFNQTALGNWAAGGQNNLTLGGVLGVYAHYETPRHYWVSLFDGSYSLTKIEDLPLRKIQDYWEFNTKYGYKFRPTLSVTGFVEAISQFSNGYDLATDPEQTRRTSTLFAPGFFNQGLGLTYSNTKAGFVARFAPLTARQIFVLADDVNEVAYGLDSGATVRMQLGASLRLGYTKEIVKNLNVESRLFAFLDYLRDPDQVLVNWRNKFDYKLARVFTISLLVHLIYDPNVQFPKETRLEPDGTTTVLSTEPRLQWLQMLGIGLGYNFRK